MEYIIILGIFVLLIVAQTVMQRRRNKKVQALQEGLRSGTRVRTAGGFIGTVKAVTADTVIILCGPEEVQLELLKGAVAPLEEGALAGESPEYAEDDEVVSIDDIPTEEVEESAEVEATEDSVADED